MDRYFWHLSSAQADGMACVVCGADYLNERITSLPIGRDPKTESQVFACKEPCAGVIADEAERMAREVRAAVGANVADGAEQDDGDDSVFCVDGHFGSLLRDLRTLAGTEALLATVDDIPAIRFLLALTARHAQAAMMRARLVLARTPEEGKD